MKTISKLLLALAATTSLGGCAVIDGVRGDSGKKNNTPTVGARVSILGTERDTEVDASLADVAVTLPPALANEAWAQPGGNAAKSPGNAAWSKSETHLDRRCNRCQPACTLGRKPSDERWPRLCRRHHRARYGI